MDRPKRPPPVPKFQDSNDKAELEKKLNSFINSIATTPLPQQVATAVPSPSAPSPSPSSISTPTPPKQQAGKKKLTLASLNSKLNNMLSAKKIAISTAISGQAQKKEKEQQQRKVIEVEYDPQHPNSYQLVKHQYLTALAALEDDLNQDEEEAVVERSKGEMEDEGSMLAEEQGGTMVEEKEQVALRMMQKFGYKVGQGLGRQGQGIRTPLIVRKTTDSSGIIEQSAIPLNFLIPPEVSARNALSAHGVECSEVIVLVGLVSMAELQEGVQEEIKQECCLHGVVCDWMLYLLEGQLRIFVEFQTREQALNAFVRMNGKYFGEKLVSVRFYPLQRFRERALAQPLHAHVPT